MINQSYKPNLLLEILWLISFILGIYTGNPIFIALLIFVFICNQIS